MQSLIILGVIWLFRYVGKTRSTSVVYDISLGIIYKSVWYFGE